MSTKNPFDITDVSDVSQEIRNGLTKPRNRYGKVFDAAPNEFNADMFYVACNRMGLKTTPTTARQALHANVKKKRLVRRRTGWYSKAS